MENIFDPASEKQIAFLKELHYDGELEGLTKEEATILISKLTKEKKAAKQEEAPAENAQVQTPAAPDKKDVVVSSHSKALQVLEKNISDKVLNQINVLQEEQGLVLPENYNAANALKMAYLKLAQDNLLTTDQTALSQALLNMCIQGLDPAKNQCYFISFAGKVNMMRSYFGDRSVCINHKIVQDIQANIIYEGDEVNVSYVDNWISVEHKTKWDNFSKPIVGAYAWAILPNGKVIYDIMTMDRIKKSWAMSKNNSNNKLQANFSDDACKRTVTRHMAKNLFNSSNSSVVANSWNESTENEYDNKREFINANVDEVHEEQQKLSGKKRLVEDENGVVEDDNI